MHFFWTARLVARRACRIVFDRYSYFAQARIAAALALLVSLSWGASVQALEALCAEVVIEIQQELALERQAFEARMRISNGLDTLALENLSVEVHFEDQAGDPVIATSDPGDTSATFFIREDQLTGVNAVDGTGTISAASEAEVRWLIVPGSNAAGQLENGRLYFVGATLSYTFGGTPQSIDVAPDTIVVKPQPLLTLDYFLTEQVVGDDAFTPEIEAPVPYTLGVRVANNGAGVARGVTIDSAQPRIVENDQGLAVGFRINQSYVDDKPVQPTLLLDFGDIEGGDVSVGRWLMETTLSGEFVSFSASFSHADELGGQLTSLLETVNTHILLRDVRVDLPGRDSVRDFLARDGTEYHVYESEPTGMATAVCEDCAAVLNVSALALLSAGQTNGNLQVHQLTTPDSPGFSLAQVADPYGGARSIHSVTRSDGKVVRHQNAWLSRRRAENGVDFDHFVNVFDVASTGSYEIVFGDTPSVPLAPVFSTILDRETFEGGQVGFLVQASDPNGDPVALSSSNLPSGATLSDQGNGRATFQWFPVPGQSGDYAVEFRATDGALSSTLVVNIRVNSAGDTDGDGLSDDWELTHFGDLSRDGSGDFDDDGYSDAQEHDEGTDPTTPAEAPGPPQIASPAFAAEVLTVSPDLVVVNAIHGSSVTVVYDFELFDDPGYTNLIGSATDVVEGIDTTQVTVDGAFLFQLSQLADNTRYFWRARGRTATHSTDWTASELFVNQANDAPEAFSIAEPLANSIAASLMPVIVVPNPSDVDGDDLVLRARLFVLNDLATPLIDVGGIALDADGTTEWTIPNPLVENESYRLIVSVQDEHGLETEAAPVDFVVSTVDDPPPVPTVLTPAVGGEVADGQVDLVVSVVEDPEGQPISYFFELDTVSSFDSPALRQSPALSGGVVDVRWNVVDLEENTTYYWRVRSDDGAVTSGWSSGSFFVNAVEELPPAPTVANPADTARVEVLMPLLELFAVVEPDNDSVTYEFELYADGGASQLVAGFSAGTPAWQLDFELSDNTDYWWRGRAVDEHGLAGDWSSLATFFVNLDGVDDAPTLMIVEPSSAVVIDTGSFVIQWSDADPDSNAQIDLFYNGVNPIVTGLSEDPDGGGDQYVWDVSALAPGDYLISAVIDDGSTSNIVDACCFVTIPAPPGDAEILVTPPVDLQLDEAGVAMASGSVALSAEPIAPVTVNVSLDDTTEAELTTSPVLVFDSTNWNVPQVFEISGQDDCDVDGDQQVTLSFTPVVSEDAAYDGLVPGSLALSVKDNETAGQQLFICEYRVDSALPTPFGMQYTLFPQLENRGVALDGAEAIAGTYPGDVTVAGSDAVSFPAVGSNAVVESLESIDVVVWPGTELDQAKLFWNITPGNSVHGLTGTAGNDVLQGTEGDDVIEGLAGHDTLYGNDGDDTLIGGPGADTVYGGNGNDTVVIEGDDPHADRVDGGAGYDRVVGGAGDDAFRFLEFGAGFSVEEIDGVTGTDIIAGTSGNNVLDFGSALLLNIDTIYGLGGHDTIYGSNAADVIEGGPGDDTMFGNGGDDVFRFVGSSSGHDIISGGGGIDSLLGTGGDDTIQLYRFSGDDTVELIDGGAGVDLLTGSSNHDVLDFSGTTVTNIAEIRGLAGHDTISGSSGNDRIRGGGGDDTMYGGAGDDVFVVEGTGDGEDRVDGGDGFDTVLGGPLDDAIQFSLFFGGSWSVEVVDGNGGSNWIEGTNGHDTLDFSLTTLIAIDRIEGLGGSDTIVGTTANDLIVGGPGPDTLFGMAGDDVFLVLGADTAPDWFDGGDGTDTIQGGAGDDTVVMSAFDGNSSVEIIDLGAGTNIVSGGNGNDVLDFSQTSFVGIDRIDGSGGHDTLSGTAAADVMVGGSGNDTLFGNAGDDTFLLFEAEGQGADRYDGGDGFDSIVGTDGDDIIGLSHFSADYTVERIAGGLGENIIQGTGANNTLDFSATELLDIARIEGMGGHDTIFGSSGPDVIAGGPGNDTLRGGGGDDTFVFGDANGGVDQYEGGDGFDRILGGDGDDVLELGVYQGTFQVERIDGGTGTDVITGSVANDTLDFSTTTLVNISRIDGLGGQDTILGSAAADVISGGPGADTLYGNDGDDTFLWTEPDTSADEIAGGDGFDVLLGSSGDDVLRLRIHIGDSVLERIDGGGGFDVIAGTVGNDTLDFGSTDLVGIGRIDGLGGQDTIVGSAGADVIVGGAGADALSGGGGNDTFLLEGADGHADRYAGDEGFDTVLGSNEDETIVLATFLNPNTVERIDGGGGVDVIAGTVSNDVLNFSSTELLGIARIDGLAGADSLFGSAAADVLVGGAGDDTLQGGHGGDTYLIGPGDGQDTVSDSGDSGATTDLVEYLAGIDHQDLWFYRSGATLFVYRLGSMESVNFQRYFLVPEMRVELIRTATHEISGTDIDALSDVMTPFGQPSGGSVSLTPAEQDQVDAAIDTYWQTR